MLLPAVRASTGTDRGEPGEVCVSIGTRDPPEGRFAACVTLIVVLTFLACVGAAMDKFVARENIRHFRDRLEVETDPTSRLLLRKLLLQEEDKLGHDSEALREIENHIARVKEHVSRQQAAITSTERAGQDATHALVLLSNYSEVLLAYESQREKILIRLEQSRL